MRDPIIVWGKTIIDGHNRYAIIQKHPEIPFTIQKMDFEDSWSAIEWMCKNQLGRRNLSIEQKSYMLGKLYEARKNAHNGYADRPRGERGRFAANSPGESNRLADIIAVEQGVSPKTVHRAYEFSSSVDKSEETTPGFRAAVLSGNTKATRADIRAMNKMDKAERKEVADTIMRGETPEIKKSVPVPRFDEPEPYNEEDFRLELGQFAPHLDKTIEMTLEMHGDMLKRKVCKSDFAAMLDDVQAVVKKYREVLKNES